MTMILISISESINKPTTSYILSLCFVFISTYKHHIPFIQIN